MYRWIWNQLPGSTGVRVVVALLLLAMVVTVLVLVVFPGLELLLPFSDVNVGLSNPVRLLG